MEEVEVSQRKLNVKFRDVVVLFLFFLIVLVITFVASYQYGEQGAFRDGYEVGSYHTMLYNSATDNYPSREWRDNHFSDVILNGEDILRTLEEDYG